MTIVNGDNYKLQWVDKPSEKLPKGENAGRKRLLLEHYTADYAIQVGDTVLGPKIPASSIVTGAFVKINKSLGATGIFNLGYLANGVDAADTDAFITGADAGGQAVWALPAAGQAGILKRFTKETQLVLIATEVMDGAVLDGVIEFGVEYVND